MPLAEERQLIVGDATDTGPDNGRDSLISCHWSKVAARATEDDASLPFLRCPVGTTAG